MRTRKCPRDSNPRASTRAHGALPITKADTERRTLDSCPDRWTWAADIGGEFALDASPSTVLWERALRRVAEERHAGRPAGKGELGNVPEHLDPGW